VSRDLQSALLLSCLQSSMFSVLHLRKHDGEITELSPTCGASPDANGISCGGHEQFDAFAVGTKPKAALH
jgi:hypothetical protein